MSPIVQGEMAELTARKVWLQDSRREWIAPDGRRGMKVSELVERLSGAGYRNRDGDPITEGTVRGWEAPSTGDVPDKVIPYLERIFKTRAPGSGVTDAGDLAAVVREQQQAIATLTGQIEQMLRTQQATNRVQTALAALAIRVLATGEPEIAAQLRALLDDVAPTDRVSPVR